MGKKKKSNKSKVLKVIYAICVIAVFIAGLYYENGYTDINVFINDMTKDIREIHDTLSNNVKETLTENNTEQYKNIEAKPVTGILEMHTIDVGQRR